MTVVGQLCGKYRLVESIGRGAVGEVFRAEHDLTGDVVAVKVFDDGVGADEEIVKGAFDKARAATRLNQPSIIRVLDYGRTDTGAIYLAMDLLMGESLSSRLGSSGALTVEKSLALVQDLAEALEAAHSVDAPHGDIKPSSIFIIREPTAPLGERAILLDFGVCAFSRDNLEASPGSAEIRSPERWRGEEPSAASDVYALGCVLHHMLAGQPVFEAGDGIEAAHTKTVPAPITDHLASAPLVLVDLVAAMLAKEHADRPASDTLATRLIDVGDIVADLASGLAEAPKSESLYAEDELTVLDGDALGPMPSQQPLHEILRASREKADSIDEAHDTDKRPTLDEAERDTLDPDAVDEDIEVDLPAPVPRKELAPIVASPEPLAVQDTQDDLGPKILDAETVDPDAADDAELPAPVGADDGVMDLPAPVAKSRHDDLPAPVLGAGKKGPAALGTIVPKQAPLKEPETIEDLGNATDPLPPVLTPPSPVTFRPVGAAKTSEPPAGGELALLEEGDSKQPVAVGALALVTDGDAGPSGGLATVEKGAPSRVSEVAAKRAKGAAGAASKRDPKPPTAKPRAKPKKPIDPILASMIEDSAMGDDAPTMIVPAAIDASLLAEDEERSKDRRPHPTTPPKRVGGGMALPDTDDDGIERRIPQDWIKWGAIGGGVFLVLLIFILARSCDDGAPDPALSPSTDASGSAETADL